MKTQKKDTAWINACIRPVLIGVLVGGVVCLITLMLMAFVLTLQDIPQNAALPLASVASAAGAFVGGLTAGRIAGRNGWLIGGISAILLFLLTMVSGFSLFSQLDGGFLMAKFAIMFACGMIGGMVAVNLKKRRR